MTIASQSPAQRRVAETSASIGRESQTHESASAGGLQRTQNQQARANLLSESSGSSSKSDFITSTTTATIGAGHKATQADARGPLLVPEQLKEIYQDQAVSQTMSDKFSGGQVDSFDHVTFWVGNAKQSAVFYMTQFGFQPFAFRGLETGSRDLACHVVRLNETIIQFVSAVEPNNKQLNEFLLSHGDAVKDVAFRVHNLEALLEHALHEGAELVHPLEIVAFDADSPSKGNQNGHCHQQKEANNPSKLIVKRATIKTFGDVTHTFIERNYEYDQLAKFLPGYHKPSLEVS